MNIEHQELPLQQMTPNIHFLQVACVQQTDHVMAPEIRHILYGDSE